MSEKKKCGCFGKLLKCLLWCVLGAIALVVVIAATLPLWLSPIATSVANSAVPKITGTDFRIERFYVNPWTGAVRINGVKLSNPEGFGDAPAFSMTSFTLDLSITELFSNTLHIKELIIEDPFASYYSHDGVNNIDAIMANVNKALGAKDDDKDEDEEKPEKDEDEIKVIIDHLRISGTKVKLMETSAIPPLSIMTIELSDIGKKSNGATLEDAWKEISDAFMKSMGNIGDGLNALGGILGDGAKGLSDALGDGAKSAADLTTGAAGAVGDGAAAAAGAVGDGAKAAVDAVGDTAKQATEGVKNLFKGIGK